jgi:hypothetical protein
MPAVPDFVPPWWPVPTPAVPAFVPPGPLRGPIGRDEVRDCRRLLSGLHRELHLDGELLGRTAAAVLTVEMKG